ncbi:MAG: TetR/AcrR family transcriptional regulator [Candidatus Cloacimonetes bacterium]|nr:TetR/AcrR family transcriptional regulator [Candidatus Cloacimonadota bacterium]
MARISKEHAVRKMEIMETAKKLFYTCGYDTTSVNQIIAVLGISKGAFYHYFKSKEDLLDEIIGQFIETVITRIKPIVENPRLDPLSKLNKWISEASALKVQNPELMKTFIDVLYKKENILIREKYRLQMNSRVVPELTRLIEEGVETGTFHTPYPRETAIMIINMGITSNDVLSNTFQNLPDPVNLDRLIKWYKLYELAFARLLGIPENSIRIIKDEIIQTFFRV